MVLKISLCFLALVNLSTSNEYSGLLSHLYKKASNENRPLILVLDNSLKDADDSSRADKTPAVNVDNEKDIPLNLLELLNQKRHSSRHEHNQQPILSLLTNNRDDDFSFKNPEQREPNIKQNVLQRVRDRLQREKELRRQKKLSQERRERKERRERERKIRAQYEDDDREDINQQDRDEDRHQNRNLDKFRDTLQNLNQDRNKNVQQNQQKNQALDKKRVLRSSVIKNLLRTFNDLNCDAKDECQDECGQFNGKKQNACEDKCEVKYECEESEPEDPCAEKDDCAESEEFVSTRGERLVTVTEKCKRC